MCVTVCYKFLDPVWVWVCTCVHVWQGVVGGSVHNCTVNTLVSVSWVIHLPTSWLGELLFWDFSSSASLQVKINTGSINNTGVDLYNDDFTVDFIKRWLSLQILKSLEPWERCVFVSVSIYEGLYLKCWLPGENSSSGVCLWWLSEAFLRWLRADRGLYSEPCSSVR